MKKGNMYLYLIVIFLIFLGIAIKIPGKGTSNNLINTILSVASFVFGVIVAFSIANRHSRLNNIRSSLRTQDSLFIELYYLSKTFDKKVVLKMRTLIDEVLVSQIDYHLEDFYKDSPKRIKSLCLFIENLKTKNDKQKIAKDKMLDCVKDLLNIQKEVEYEVRNDIMWYEWASLVILEAIILFCLFYLNNNSWISIIIIPFLSVSLMLLLFVLGQLDSLKFQEGNWIWRPLAQLFLELDLLPYFSDDIFEESRLKLSTIKNWDNIKKIRLAHYARPYPDFSGKKVEVITL